MEHSDATSYKIYRSFSCPSYKEAHRFFWPENHWNSKHQKTIAEFVENYYQEGDCVLVEQPFDQEIIQSENNQVKQIRINVTLFGWDDPLSRKILAVYESRIHEASTLAKASEEELLGKKITINEDLITAIKNINEFFEEKPELKEIYKRKNDKEWRSLKTDKLGSQWYYQNIYSIIKVLQHRALDETVEERAGSLILQLKNLKSHKRIFVIGGRLHFLINEQISSEQDKRAVGKLYDYLSKSKRASIIFDH